MQERIFGLEIEYAVSFHPDEGGKIPDAEKIFKALSRSLTEQYGIPGSLFLVNGSKFYYDIGHAEWSLPECRSAREAVVYDRAADYALGATIPAAEHVLLERGYRGKLLVVKNNADTEGHTYGCHENYMTERRTEWLEAEDQLRLTVRYLVPFLVTRQVYCGAGRVGFGPRLEEGIGFQMMQRADFIDAVVSKETRKERAIINIGREDEPLAAGNYRRLHLILADANMSGWATYLKLGTTAIVLRMLEDLCFGDIPHLQDPLSALRQISRDPTCTTRVPLRDGRRLTAVEIQRIYLEQAQRYFELYEASAEEREILQLWARALDDLEQDPRSLFGKVDWVTKKSIMDHYLERVGLEWEDIRPEQPAYYELLRMDIEYHNLCPNDGLFYRLLRGKVDTLVSNEEIQRAQTTPPPYTRARVRGDLIAAARRTGVKVEVDRWDQVRIGWHGIPVDNPFEFLVPEMLLLFKEGIPQGEHGVSREHNEEPDIEDLLRELLDL